jgi:Tol biopolymer transport system component
LVLVENRGCVLTKDELLNQVWGGAIVEEGGLTRNVSTLRKVLGERPDEHRYIVTVPGQGYQFVADVREKGEDGRNSTIRERMAPDVPPLQAGTASGGGTGFDRLKLKNPRVVIAVGMLILAIPLTLQLWPVGPRSTPDAPSRMFRLTSTAGFNTEPALTRDGTFVAYASDRGGGGNLDIWVQAVGGGDPIQRTSQPADETEPSFAADGSQIVFSRRDSGIYVIGTLNGAPRLVAPIPWGRTPRFSPDGKWIVFWTGFPPSVVAGGVPEAVGNMYVVPSGGGEPHLIDTPLASERYPIWSPDGDYLLFLGEESPELKTHDWYVVHKDGGDPIKTGAILALRAEGLHAGIPIPGSWRAADSVVVFATNEPEISNIWQIAITPSTGRLSGKPRRLTFGTAIERNPATSQSGRIAFASAHENVDVWRLALDANTGKVSGDVERVTDSAATDVLRNISSDGRSLTFLSSRSGRTEVWVKDIATNRYRQLTFVGVEDASASNDGRKVAYAKSEAGSQYIEVLESAAGLPSKFCKGCNSPWDWSPDGTRLLFGRGLPAKVFIQDFESGREAELLRHDRWGLYMARFSPDGRWVAYHATPSPNVRQIYAVPVHLDGHPLRSEKWVPIVMDHGCHPNWSPDGRLVYYFSFRDGHFCLYAQPVDDVTKRAVGPFRDVQHFHGPRIRASTGIAAYNDIQADYIYVSLSEAVSNVWVLEAED